MRVTPDALRQIRGGHPWVYDRSITSVAEGGEPGDLGVVFDDKRRFAAIGLWDPGSPIRIKVLHTGSPTPVDGSFWLARFTAAADLRQPLVADPGTDGFRLVHGENDGLPGLVVDVYGDTAVVKLYSVAWLPHLDAVLDALAVVAAPATTVLRLARNLDPSHLHGLADGAILRGERPVGAVPLLENGLRFEADVIAGQKTGHFLDQRDNRARVRDRAEGAAVLDVFSCTGGFSVYAAAGGARRVHSVDIAPRAIATAERAMAQNRGVAAVARCGHDTTVGDAFAVMEAAASRGESYDVVVVDPPSFASKQSDVAGALRAYSRLTVLAVDLLTPEGLLVQASCSSRIDADAFASAVLGAVDATGRRLATVEQTAHPIDHPIGFPEGAYLKAVFGRLTT